MYNSDFPSRAELPSTGKLVRSTLIAAISAVVLLTTVVLPSEYGVDPTGIGHVLGLTEMGQIKTRLAKEAAEDAATKPSNSEPAAAAEAVKPTITNPAASPSVDQPDPNSASTSDTAVWRDEMSFTLAPGQGSEVKLKMKEGEKALYSWSVKGGVVNFDTHGDAIGRSISYEKGRGVANAEGELVAAFTGNHGWFWRNRGDAEVTVVLQTGGAYSDIKRLK
jgi:hypothetical protein